MQTMVQIWREEMRTRYLVVSEAGREIPPNESRTTQVVPTRDEWKSTDSDSAKNPS